MLKHWKLYLLIVLGLAVAGLTSWWALDDDPGEHPDDGCGSTA